MSELMRCESCHGKKKIMGMGAIEKLCDNCNGVGWTEVEFDRPIETEGLKTPGGVEVPVKIKKKPGPKPRIVISEDQVNE